MVNHTFLAVGLHLASDVQIKCSSYADKGKGPILTIDHPGGWIDLSPISREAISVDDVTLARNLVEQATIYLAECERLAESPKDDHGIWPDGEPEQVRDQYDAMCSESR